MRRMTQRRGTEVVDSMTEEQQSYAGATAEQPGYAEEQSPGYAQHGAYEQQPAGYDQQVGQDQQQGGGYDQYTQQQPGGYEPQPGGYDQQQQQQGGYDLNQQPGGYDQQPSELSSQLPDQQTSEPSEAPTFFNPSEVNPGGGGAPTFFNPSSLPAIPEQMTRKTSLSRQGSLSSPTPTIPTQLSRQSSLTPRSRQGSESVDHSPAPAPSSYYGAVQKVAAPPTQKSPEKEQPVAKAGKKAAAAPTPAPKKSWFGGIFSKIIKSDQVHLPDDKDKTIVYDEAKGRWVNLDGDDDDLAPAAPPPMDPAFSAPASGPTPAGPAGPGSGPPAAPTSYRAGLGSRRGRSGYVDVLGQAGLSKPMTNPLLPNGGAPPPGPPSMGSLVPPAMLNPNMAPISNDGPTSLATSNPYMVPDSGQGKEDASTSAGPASMPMMFNPSNMAGEGAEQPPGF